MIWMAVERRFSSQRRSGVNQSRQSLFCRLPRHAAGIYFRCEIRFSLSGQARSWRKALRGTPTFGIAPEVFVCFIENHDQIANTGRGKRLRFQTSHARYRAMTAVLLLGPWTPMLFQGEEFGARSAFMFFADIGDAPVREAIRRGRAGWLAPFLSLTKKKHREVCGARRSKGVRSLQTRFSPSVKRITSFIACISIY